MIIMIMMMMTMAMMMRMTAGTSFGSAVNCRANKKGEMIHCHHPMYSMTVLQCTVLKYCIMMSAQIPPIKVPYYRDAILYCCNAVLYQMPY